MIKRLIAASSIALLLCGCVNCIVRHSPNPPHIESVYQPTRMAAGATVIMACPQMMSDAPTSVVVVENIFTIPLGILAFCVDVPLEFVIDTLCLPYDLFTFGGFDHAEGCAERVAHPLAAFLRTREVLDETLGEVHVDADLSAPAYGVKVPFRGVRPATSDQLIGDGVRVFVLASEWSAHSGREVYQIADASATAKCCVSVVKTQQMGNYQEPPSYRRNMI